MGTSLIVARMKPGSAEFVHDLFADFDRTNMPHQMGTLRRQLFRFHGLYFHLQEFEDDQGQDRIESAKSDPRFIKISQDLKPFIQAYDPETWKSPKDALAERFYDWTSL